MHTDPTPWRRLVLETSLKPFAADGRGAWRQTAHRLWTVWEALARRAEHLAVLLWVGDGSEILDWSGRPEQPLEYGRHVGFCNIGALPDLYFSNWYDNRPGRPWRTGLPDLAYSDLADILAALREAADDLLGRPIELGATFDPGPEFAYSKFKYAKHPEILFPQPPGRMLAPMHFVTCQAHLNADPGPYAAFPDGVADGTSLGTFLGRQMRAFADGLGYDYLWLSNGFGYSHFAWTMTGETLRDGAFHPERAEAQRAATNGFWRDFRAECPDLPLEVRGTDWSVAMDLGSDGVSHRDIQDLGALDAGPPNIPVLQAELLAKDVTVFLTRMAGAPTRRILYRTYLNDPWFEQNPWYHMYDREPFETYACLACARLRGDGSVDTPTDLHILTVDTEQGELLPDEANEVTPHYLRAAVERADAPGPLVWLYPWRDLDQALKDCPERLSQAWFGDHFIWRSIEGGLPLNTVCEARDFAALVEAGRAPDVLYIAPAPLFESSLGPAVLRHVAAGGRAIVYGPLDHAPELREALGLSLGDPIDGDLSVECDIPLDPFADCTDPTALPLRHRPLTSGGPVREAAADPDAVRIAVRSGDACRAYAVHRADPAWGGGALAWVRGTCPFDVPADPPHHRSPVDDPRAFFRPQDLLRRLLSLFGWDILQPRLNPGVEPTRLFIKRHHGAFFFAGSKADTTVHLRIRTPAGAPVFTGYDTPLDSGYAEEHFGKTIYCEVRFFARGQEAPLTARRVPEGVGFERAYHVTGSSGATLTLYPDPDALRDGRVLLMRGPHDNLNPEGTVPAVAHETDLDRGRIVIPDHSGPLFVKW
jgi:hypothetical protein